MNSKQDEVELLPCPFCGGPAERRLTDGSTRGFVGCFLCMIGTPFNAPYGDREREAWNNRAQPLCPLHKSLSGKLEVVIGHNCVACSLNERAALLNMLAPFASADGSKDSLEVLQSIIDTRVVIAGYRRWLNLKNAHGARAGTGRND